MDYKEKVIALLNSQELSKEQKEKLENIFPELKDSITISKVEYEYLKEIEKRMDILIQSFEIQKETLLHGLDLLNQRKIYELQKEIQRCS